MIVIGIDLGTSNSTLSYFKNNNFHIIKDNDDHNIASIISFTKYGNIFGNKAKNIKDNNIFISNIKRLIGYKYSDIEESYYKQFSGVTIFNNNNNIGILINDVVYSPDEIMIYFLNYLKQLINNDINLLGEAYRVIVTVPAYFNIQQKEAINNCIKLANFDLIKLLSEPVSASIAYGNFINYNNDDNIFIFDLGGGTLDLSIINISNDETEKLYEVRATYGDNKFGGSDLTFILIDFIKTKYPHYDLSNNNLFEYIDNLKIKLSSGCIQETIIIDKQSITIQNDEWDFMVDLWLNNINTSLQNILDIAKLSINDINHVLLVGGSSKITHINKKLSDFFKCTITQQFIGNIPLQDIAVSYGSSLHGNILYSTKDLILIDVCPFTIGIETSNNIMVPIIERNSQIPINRTKQFTTEDDYMLEVKIKIYQGESKLTTNNIFIGEFVLGGIQKAPKGVPVINVNISINSNGLLCITAADRKNFTRNELIITANDYKLSDNDIETIKFNMNKNKDNEDILFNLIEKYNSFIIDFERFVYNLIINPVSKFHPDYVLTIKNEIMEQLFEIHFIINDNTFNDLISFNKFLFFFESLYSQDEFNSYNRKNKDYNNIMIYLKLLFENLRSFMFDKYQNLLMTFDNNSMDNKTFVKHNLSSESNTEFSSINDDLHTEIVETHNQHRLQENSIIKEVCSSDLSSNEIHSETLQLYNDTNELIHTLLDELPNFPINDDGKLLLTNFINNIKDSVSKYNTDYFNKFNDIDYVNLSLFFKSTINNINDYCNIISINNCL